MCSFLASLTTDMNPQPAAPAVQVIEHKFIPARLDAFLSQPPALHNNAIQPSGSQQLTIQPPAIQPLQPAAHVLHSPPLQTHVISTQQPYVIPGNAPVQDRTSIKSGKNGLF